MYSVYNGHQFEQLMWTNADKLIHKNTQINNSLFRVSLWGKRLLSDPVYTRVQIQTNRQTKKERKKSIKK